ncbi:hypothetical protein [Legionella maioricensis]|uniref:Uncharacterized protein n=1 Tax=Legionella maioricensis TaxID=2896528 RepID=A0A9X2D2S4_9GAMM|nr:hypothetical protein [Legionella maioricensis]MCL9685187.1 hypothetical protein [Legionella maioricensis]MCL9688404.1 hypothetical protein [Legionella maioricensis]
MRHISLATAQTANACTLISIAVINAILSAENEQEIYEGVKLAHEDSQRRYRQDFPAVINGTGLLETQAYARYYSSVFANPKKQSLVAPIDGLNVEDILDNRDGFIRDNRLEGVELAVILFIEQNADVTAAIQKLAPDTQINWATITVDELRRIVRPDNTPPLAQQFLPIITQLDSQGITIKMAGHTISLVKKGDTYYSYDSLTGDLSVTKNPQEMVAHLDTKIVRDQAKDAEVYFFTPIKDLKLAPKTPIQQPVKKEVPVEEKQYKVEVVETPVLSAEQIHDLINNRPLFHDVAMWQQVNADLFALIVSKLNGVLLTVEDWAVITAEQLLNIKSNPEQNPEPIAPSFVSGRSNSTLPATLPHVSILPGDILPDETGIKKIVPDIKSIVRDVPVINEPEQPVRDSEKLMAIIDKLIENMSTQQNGRQTTRNSQWKADLLTDIKQAMQSTNPDAININQCIADIRTVCAKKRNILHFWAQPHSVSEFETMLRDAEITTSQANVLIQ